MEFDRYQIMTPADAQGIVVWASTMDWEQGLARTKEATGTIKKNMELKAENNPASLSTLQRIGTQLFTHPDLPVDQMVKRATLPKLNRYRPDEEYQRHGDSAVMGGKVRTDLACTVFLSHPETYEGGELCVEDSMGGVHEIKGSPGTCVVYPCHMPHWVQPVKSGERIAAITWFESCYRDVEQRLVMKRFLRVLKDMEKDPSLRYGKNYTSLGTIHGRLQRMWIDYR